MTPLTFDQSYSVTSMLADRMSMVPTRVPFIQAHVFCMLSIAAFVPHSGRVPPPPGPQTRSGTDRLF